MSEVFDGEHQNAVDFLKLLRCTQPDELRLLDVHINRWTTSAYSCSQLVTIACNCYKTSCLYYMYITGIACEVSYIICTFTDHFSGPGRAVSRVCVSEFGR